MALDIVPLAHLFVVCSTASSPALCGPRVTVEPASPSQLSDDDHLSGKVTIVSLATLSLPGKSVLVGRPKSVSDLDLSVQRLSSDLGVALQGHKKRHLSWRSEKNHKTKDDVAKNEENTQRPNSRQSKLERHRSEPGRHHNHNGYASVLWTTWVGYCIGKPWVPLSLTQPY